MSERPSLCAFPDILYGWEPRMRYVEAEGVTRNQARYAIAYDGGEDYIAVKARKVWLCHRELTEDDALGASVEEWYPGYKGWIGCHRDDEGAVAWWEVEIPRA